MADVSPYSTIEPLITSTQSYLAPLEAQRVASYDLYDAIYWNVPETFKIKQRGTDADPVYIPSGRIIADTTNRYTAADFGFTAAEGTDAENLELTTQLNALFRRERFFSRFAANKLDGIIRGDWCWHIVGDLTKLPGRRLSILPVHPGSVYKITALDNPDSVIGYDIIKIVVVGNDSFVQTQRYQKGQWVTPADFKRDAPDVGTIFSSVQLWKLDDWGSVDDQGIPDSSPEAMVIPTTPLHPFITALPVYHIPHNERTTQLYGNSELRGMERIMAALNQSISDEELALALEGLGMYATTSGPPRDDQGNESNWVLGPGRVVELDAVDGQSVKDMWDRIGGVGSVTPMQDHIKMLIEFLREGSGATDAAVGKVDVQVAESGIALQLQLAPMLAKVGGYDTTITDVHRQMFFDLRAWLTVYEAIPVMNSLAVAEPTMGDKIPINRKERFEEIMTMFTSKLVPASWAAAELGKLGYVITAEDLGAVAEETSAMAAAADPFAARAAEESELEEEEVVV